MIVVGLALVLLLLLLVVGAVLGGVYYSRSGAEAGRAKAEAFAEEKRLREERERQA